MNKPASLRILRNAIDQRQHELADGGMHLSADFLLNAMQQIYYEMMGEPGPNTPVFGLLTDQGLAMFEHGLNPPKWKPPKEGDDG